MTWVYELAWAERHAGDEQEQTHGLSLSSISARLQCEVSMVDLALLDLVQAVGMVDQHEEGEAIVRWVYG